MRNRTLAALAVAAALVAACGGDDETTDTSEPLATDVPATGIPETDVPATEAPTTEAPATEVTTTTEAVESTEPATTEVASTTAQPTSTPAPDGDAAGSATCTPVTIESGGTTIAGERCDPAEPVADPRPAAIVLNGCGGYESDDEITSATVRAVAERGMVALRIDWLGAVPAPPDTYCDAGSVIAAVEPLLTAVVDGVASLRADPTVDGDRIATASYSLGALGAMAADLGGAGLTTVEPLELRAAALLSYPNQLPTITAAAESGEVPPLFLMTGELDDVAPPADAQALADAATIGGVANELVIVPDQDHPWRGDAALAAGAAMADALAALLVS